MFKRTEWFAGTPIIEIRLISLHAILQRIIANNK